MLAVALIQLGADTRQVVGRFEAARISNPNPPLTHPPSLISCPALCPVGAGTLL